MTSSLLGPDNVINIIYRSPLEKILQFKKLSEKKIKKDKKVLFMISFRTESKVLIGKSSSWTNDFNCGNK